MKKIIIWSAIISILFIILFFIIPKKLKNTKGRNKQAWVQIMEIKHLDGKKVYIPKWSGYTPAKVYIDFAYSIETQGQKVAFLFPCVNEWIYWDGKGHNDQMKKIKDCKGWVTIQKVK